MLKLDGFVPGMSAVVQKKVEESDTASNYGSGVLGRLLATPVFVQLVIKASTETVDPLLPDGYVTVGKSMEISHEAPTSMGMTISVQSTLEKVEGNRLFFRIVACDALGDVGYGRHERIIVSEKVLWEKAQERLNKPVKELKNYRI
jgi:fluoroacetyl-CoA thioesterase